MKFRTEVLTGKPAFRITTKSPVLLTGSCFSANIGEKMKEGWEGKVWANPCGVVYNPISIGLLYQLALTGRGERRAIIASSLTQREGHWATWLMDSKTSGLTPEECIDAAMEKIDALEEAIERAEMLIVTFGTSWVYLLGDSDRAVGNCHKHPASHFTRKRLGVEETVALWKATIGMIRQRNPEIKAVFTVSPVRYPGDGMAENSFLKSVLLLACETLTKELENTDYFPAYEIMNDDLRDYRFYEQDMLHPSRQAVDYIWEKFSGLYLSESDRREYEANRKRYLREQHRPIIQKP